jgi:Ice-binding-like/Prealbumin-like fold domain
MKSKSRHQNLKRMGIFTTLLAISLSNIPGSAFAVEAPLTMGTSSAYALLSYEQTTSNTPSSVSGNAGVHIGVGAAASHTGTISGYDTEDVSISGVGPATDALSAASSALADSRAGTDLLAVELGSRTLNAGAYSHSTLEINGVLTLDGQGASDSVFIFRSTSTLVTGSASSVNLINGAQACNVYWQIGSSATLGSTSSFSGHLIASTTISAETGVNVMGQLIATTGGITLLSTTVTNNGCTTPVVAPVPPVAPVVTPVAPVVTPVAPVVTPVAPVVTPVAPVVTPEVYVAPATLRVVKLVNNSHGRTSTPGDFIIHVTKNGIEVPSSPMNGISGAGRSYSLQPGTYILFEEPVDKYRGEWSGDITPGGTVTLSAGQELTVARINYDIGTTVIAPVVEELEETVRERARVGQKATINGGELPNTASPLGDSIFLGAGLIILSLIGFGSRKIRSKQKTA